MEELTGTEKILAKQAALCEELKKFHSQYHNCIKEKSCVGVLLGDILEKHSNILNTVNQVILDEHETHDFFYTKDKQQDYIGTVTNFLAISFKIIKLAHNISVNHNLPLPSPSEDAYITIQRFINTFSATADRNKWKEKFERNGLKTNGFSQKFKKTMKRRYLHTQIWTGIPLLLLCGMVIFTGEHFLAKEFSGMQLIFLKALLSLSISVVGCSLIEGNVQYNWSLTKGLSIRAMGWAGIFLLIYFLNPASPGSVY